MHFYSLLALVAVHGKDRNRYGRYDRVVVPFVLRIGLQELQSATAVLNLAELIRPKIALPRTIVLFGLTSTVDVF